MQKGNWATFYSKAKGILGRQGRKYLATSSPGLLFSSQWSTPPSCRNHACSTHFLHIQLDSRAIKQCLLRSQVVRQCMLRSYCTSGPYTLTSLFFKWGLYKLRYYLRCTKKQHLTEYLAYPCFNSLFYSMLPSTVLQKCHFTRP